MKVRFNLINLEKFDEYYLTCNISHSAEYKDVG